MKLKDLLNEGNEYVVHTISVPGIKPASGDHKHGWNIYDPIQAKHSEITLADSTLFISAKGDFKKGDKFTLRDNDTGRKKGHGTYTVQDISPAKRDDVLKMLMKHGYDYYPKRPFQKSKGTRKLLSVLHSVKGIERA